MAVINLCLCEQVYSQLTSVQTTFNTNTVTLKQVNKSQTRKFNTSCFVLTVVDKKFLCKFVFSNFSLLILLWILFQKTKAYQSLRPALLNQMKWIPLDTSTSLLYGLVLSICVLCYTWGPTVYTVDTKQHISWANWQKN